MESEEAGALEPGARLEWNRGAPSREDWLPVTYVGQSSRRPGWFVVRHAVMKWEHHGPPSDLRLPNDHRCAACGRRFT